MSIGNKSVYACVDAPQYLQQGLTYREWLIGMIASGGGVIVRSQGFEDQTADEIIRQADAIIKQLDKDKK